jgi:hypothetical protein
VIVTSEKSVAPTAASKVSLRRNRAQHAAHQSMSADTINVDQLGTRRTRTVLVTEVRVLFVFPIRVATAARSLARERALWRLLSAKSGRLDDRFPATANKLVVKCHVTRRTPTSMARLATAMDFTAQHFVTFAIALVTSVTIGSTRTAHFRALVLQTTHQSFALLAAPRNSIPAKHEALFAFEAGHVFVSCATSALHRNRYITGGTVSVVALRGTLMPALAKLAAFVGTCRDRVCAAFPRPVGQ